MTKVSASILSNYIKPTEIISQLNKTAVDYIHLDIMDGKFVDSKSWTYSEIKKFLIGSNKLLDVHLMTKDPIKYVEKFAVLNTEYIIIHYEAVNKMEEAIENIKFFGIKIGISIKPETSVEVLYPYLNKVDQILLMSVTPGKSGQSFIESTLVKIEKLKNKITELNSNAIISVDGGIDDITGKRCVESGADMLVSASFIHKDILNNIKILKDL